MSLFLVFVNLLRLAISVEFLLQLLGYLLITGLAIEVVELVRVVLQVVQLVVVHLVVLRFEVADADERLECSVLRCTLNALVLVFGNSVESALAIEVDELVAVGTYSVVLAHHVVGRIVVVVVVDTGSPLLLSVAVVEDGK